MPHKDAEARRQYKQRYYEANKQRYKNSDGTWKKPSEASRAKALSNYKPKEDARNARVKAERKANRKIGICPLCQTPDAHLYYDHDHVTGRFRGYICHRCNTMLGMARDNPNTLLAGVNYLKRAA